MEALSCSLGDREFQALLNGLKKKLFDNEKEITLDFLVQNLYPSYIESESRAVVEAEIASFEELLRRAGEGHWDVAKMETVLKRVSLAQNHSKIALTFWANEREKIHAKVTLKSVWNRTFQQLKWRVDVKAASKHVPEINEPLALFELSTSSATEGPKIARFEMSRTQVGTVLAQLDEIQKKIDEASY